MAKQDTYIEIAKMGCKKPELDVKTAPLPKVMTSAAADFFKKESGFTLKAPTGKENPGFRISGTLISLAKKTKGKNELAYATVSLVLSKLPGDKMVAGKIEGSGGVSIGKNLQGDAEFAVETATKEACTMAVKQIGHALK